MAINQSTGEIYASSYVSGVVDVFEASGSPDSTHPKLTEANGTTPYPFIDPYGLAVDNSGGPTKGDIYVADEQGQTVTQFDPSGARTAQAPITAANVPAEGTDQSGDLPPVLNNLGFKPTGVAVAPNGDIYVADTGQQCRRCIRIERHLRLPTRRRPDIRPQCNRSRPPVTSTLPSIGSGLVEFEPSGACVNSCASIDPSAYFGVATDPEDDVYAAEGGRVTEFNSSVEQSIASAKEPFASAAASPAAKRAEQCLRR